MEFSESFKKVIFEITDDNFNDKALELFRFQAENNSIYKSFLKSLKVNPLTVNSIQNIPFLPISFFKTQKVQTGSFVPKVIFQSSGTTGQERSTHLIKDPDFYSKVARACFERIYGSLGDYVILAFLPSYHENKQSSLIYMINDFIAQADPLSRFVSGPIDHWIHYLEQARRSPKKVILWAVTFALLDMADDSPQDFSDIVIIETGGMKGRRREITREELYCVLSERLKSSNIQSEYGMSELLSQAYSRQPGIFTCPPWMKILVKDLNDPFSDVQGNRQGRINVIDLANVDSCAFIGTEDIGRFTGNGGFSVIGRMDNSDIRGCNLLYLQ